MPRSFKSQLVLAVKGVLMGAADVVPGVSGGTIAFVSGIYKELIDTLHGLHFGIFASWRADGFKKTWQAYNLSFLLSLFLGIATSILSLSKGIQWLMHHYPLFLWGFFFGLVAASILYLAKQISQWKTLVITALIATTILSYIITVTKPLGSPESYWYLAFCGFVAIIAMILPGISGAFILLLLGAYQTFIGILSQLRQGILSLDAHVFWQAFLQLLCIGVGAVLGLKLFSGLLHWMFRHYKDLTLAMLTGFMIGSLNKLWPWKEVLTWRTNSEGLQVPFIEKSILPTHFEGNPKILWVLGCAVLGFLLIFVLERFAVNKKNET